MISGSRSDKNDVMKTSLLSFAGVAAIAALSLPLYAASARAADLDHEVRPLSASFDRLKINGSIDVILVQGPVASVSVDAPARTAAAIRTVVDGNTLLIDSGHGPMFDIALPGQQHPHVTVTTPLLHEIAINGSADLTSDSYVSSDDLLLHLRSSGDLTIKHLSVKKLETEIQGSADARLAGDAAEQSVKIEGSGDYQAENLKSGSAAVAIRGSGDASVWAADTLAISIAGSGGVEYWGSPSVSQSIAGSGDVRSRGPRS